MRRSRRWTDRIRSRLADAGDDRGSASLEFLTAGVLLLVPLVYLVVLLGAVQAASLGTEGAARQAARLYARAATPDRAQQVAAGAVEASLGDYGVDPAATAVAISCRPADCTGADGVVTVTVETTVALPLLPAFLGADVPVGVRVGGTATQPVPRFRADG